MLKSPLDNFQEINIGTLLRFVRLWFMFGTDPVRFSDRIGLLFTRDRSGTSPEWIQNWTCYFAGPVMDPFRTGSRTVPCKHLDQFQTVHFNRSGSVRNGSETVPCKRSLNEFESCPTSFPGSLSPPPPQSERKRDPGNEVEPCPLKQISFKISSDQPIIFIWEPP